MSRDADLFGGANMAFVISQRCGWEFTPIPDTGSIIAAILTKTTPGRTLEVDVLREVPGVTEAEIKKSLKKVEMEDGKFCYLPSPSVLLKAKIFNLAQIDPRRSDGTPRNDLKHVNMLVHICPHYLRHMARDSGAGVTWEAVMEELDYLRSVVGSATAEKAAAMHGIALTQAIPSRLNARPVEVPPAPAGTGPIVDPRRAAGPSAKR